MKNDDEMFQSVLSRRNEYKERKRKRIRTVKRTIPVLANFCFAVGIGLGLWDHIEKLPTVPMQPDINIIYEPTTETADSTDVSVPTECQTTDNEVTTAEQIITTTIPTEVDIMPDMTTETPQTKTVTTTVLAEEPNNETEPEQTSPVFTQAPATTMANEVPISTDIPTETVPIETTTPPHNHIVSSAPPISFDTIEQVIEAINLADVSLYLESYQSAYDDMFQTFKNDGFVYEMNCDDTISLSDDFSITIYPYAEYGDIGIEYFVTFKDELYQVTFYNLDFDSIDETDDIASYLSDRIGRRSDSKPVIGDTEYSFVSSAAGKIYASCLVDQEHYCTVISAVPEDEMIEFLSLFSFDKRTL